MEPKNCFMATNWKEGKWALEYVDREGKNLVKLGQTVWAETPLIIFLKGPKVQNIILLFITLKIYIKYIYIFVSIYKNA